MVEWFILLGIIGFFFFLLMRRGGMGCCGGGHRSRGLAEQKKEVKSKDDLQR